MLHLLSTLFLLSSSPAHAAPENSHFYRIKVPVKQRSCEQEALALGDRYRELSKTPVLSARCGGVTKVTHQQKEYTYYILDLQYPIEENHPSPTIESTFYGRPSMMGIGANNQYGLYAHLGDCLKDLNKRTNEFFQHTQHPVLASTCEHALSDYETSFVVRIDTIGRPAVQLNVSEDFTNDYKTGPLSKAVEKMIQANKGVIVAQEDHYVYYYSKKALRPYRHTFGEMREGQCQQQLPELNKVLRRFPQKEVTTGCLAYKYPHLQFERMEAVWNQYSYLEVYREKDFYNSFEECLRDRERAIAQRQNNGFKVKAALCHLNDYLNTDDPDRYVMEVY